MSSIVACLTSLHELQSTLSAAVNACKNSLSRIWLGMDLQHMQALQVATEPSPLRTFEEQPSTLISRQRETTS